MTSAAASAISTTVSPSRRRVVARPSDTRLVGTPPIDPRKRVAAIGVKPTISVMTTSTAAEKRAAGRLSVISCRRGISAGAYAFTAETATLRDREARERAKSAEDRRFREELSRDVRAARAKREANRELAPPADRAQQRHDRHVDARDQQHQRRGALQDAEREAHVSELALTERDEAEAPCRLAVGVGKVVAESGRDTREIARGGRGVDAGAKARHREQIAIAAIGSVARPQIERHPDRHVRLWIGEMVRHHADDRIRHSVQPNRARQHIGCAAEVRVPEARADHGYLAPPVSGLEAMPSVSTKRTPADGADSEHAEKIRRDFRDLDALGESLAFTGGGQRGTAEGGGGDAFERAGALADVTHFGARQAAVWNGSIRADVPDADEPGGIRIGRLREHDSIEHAEERGVRAHAERQRQDGDERRTQESG